MKSMKFIFYNEFIKNRNFIVKCKAKFLKGSLKEKNGLF